MKWNKKREKMSEYNKYSLFEIILFDILIYLCNMAYDGIEITE